jgi:hypothetical protein
VTAANTDPWATTAQRCGQLRCWRYPKPEGAIDQLLQREVEVLAFGEAHALLGTESIPTATERFEKQILPLLAQRGAAQLVVELLGPAQGCEKTVANVTKQQEPIVQQQDVGNQDRFVRLGHASKALGITPFILEPSCGEYAEVVRGGPDGIVRMLELIALKTQEKLTKFVEFNRSRGRIPELGLAPLAKAASPVALAYGGAMHNDIAPAAEKARFSFGKEVSEFTQGRYVEVDLIVPEFIKDTPVWRALPWYTHFDPKQAPELATLIEVGPQAFALVFARTPAPAPSTPGASELAE